MAPTFHQTTQPVVGACRHGRAGSEGKWGQVRNGSGYVRCKGGERRLASAVFESEGWFWQGLTPSRRLYRLGLNPPVAPIPETPVTAQEHPVW